MFKKYFIPSKENDYKPHILRGEGVAVLLAIVVVIELGIVGQTFLLERGSGSLANVLPAVLTDLTNNDRIQNNLQPLRVNPKLQEAAELKAADMAAKGYFAHTTPEGFTPWHWLDVAGYTYDYAGENLAVNFFESSDVEQAWMNSPGHRANIVKANYTEIGIATATGTYQGKPAIFVAQFFGTPKTVAVAASTTVASSAGTTKKVATTTKASVVATNPKSAVLAASVSPTKTTKPTTVAVAKTVSTTSTTTSAATTKKITPVENPTEIITSTNTFVNHERSAGMAALEILLFIVTVALLLTVFVEIKLQHPQIVANGVGLLFVIGFIIALNGNLFAKYTTVTTPDATITAGTTPKGF